MHSCKTVFPIIPFHIFGNGVELDPNCYIDMRHTHACKWPYNLIIEEILGANDTNSPTHGASGPIKAGGPQRLALRMAHLGRNYSNILILPAFDECCLYPALGTSSQPKPSIVWTKVVAGH